MEVVGPDMTLRPPREEDAPALLELASDPEVTQWFSWGPYTSIDEPLAYIERARGWREAGTQIDMLIVDHERGPAGITGLSEIVARDRRAVVGTWVGREFWGTGVNALSKALILHLGFIEMDLERIAAPTDVRNARSQRALEKLGFVREGVLRHYHRHGDVYKDVAMYALLRDEWSPMEGVTLRDD
ncbi:MAG TPA: GNAT family protein [Solirubrobacteraceae bacterium]